MVKEYPFTETENIRVFSGSVDPKELQWHWDEQDRMVIPLHDTDWQFQFDDHLPIRLAEGVSIFISAGAWHRVIKGTGDLSLTVIKHAVRSS